MATKNKKLWDDNGRTFQSLIDQYKNEYNTRQKGLKQTQDQNDAAARSAANETINKNYVEYMQNQRDLPGQLARLGLTGGATESAQLKARTNYENLNNSARSAMNSTLAANASKYAQDVNDLQATTLQAYNAEYKDLVDSKLAERNNRFKETVKRYDTAAKVDAAVKAAKKAGETWKIPYLQAQRADVVANYNATRKAEYKETIRRYDTVAKCDKAIANAKKAGQKWKIPILQAQRADLVAAGKTASGGGGSSRSSSRSSYRGSGGGRSYAYYSSGGGSSSSSKTKKSSLNARDAALKKRAKQNRKSSSGSSSRKSGGTSRGFMSTAPKRNKSRGILSWLKGLF